MATTDDPFVRAQFQLRLPDVVDKSSARAVLEFATRSSYPTAPDPLLAVAHAAAMMLTGMHDELHATVSIIRRVRALADRWAADNQTVWAGELRAALEGE